MAGGGGGLVDAPAERAPSSKGAGRERDGEEGRPASVDNLVLLTREEADDHDARGVALARAGSPGFAAFVEGQLRRARIEMAVV